MLTTLLNILLYALFNRLGHFANSWGNVLDNILCILFCLRHQPGLCVQQQDQRQSDGKGVWCICHLPSGYHGTGCRHYDIGGNLMAAQGAAWMEDAGVLTGVFTHLNPETLMGLTSTMVHTTDSSAAIAVIGGADGPTAIFVTGDLQSLWGMVVKVFSNVLVIVLNYVFNKLIVFKKNNSPLYLRGCSHLPLGGGITLHLPTRLPSEGCHRKVTEGSFK